MIGTTDQNFAGDLDAVAPSADEVIYLCKSVSEYFREPVGPQDVVWAFAGVRSLYDDGAGKPEDVTRDYHLTLDEQFGVAPLLTVYGGKITTYRRLAEAAMARLSHFFHGRAAWTAKAPLPGGDMLWDGVETHVARAQRTWPFLSEREARRLVGAYGTRLDRVLGDGQEPRRARARGSASFPPPRCVISWRTSGPRPPTTCCGGAPSSGCASIGARRTRWRSSWRGEFAAVDRGQGKLVPRGW